MTEVEKAFIYADIARYKAVERKMWQDHYQKWADYMRERQKEQPDLYAQADLVAPLVESSEPSVVGFAWEQHSRHYEAIDRLLSEEYHACLAEQLQLAMAEQLLLQQQDAGGQLPSALLADSAAPPAAAAAAAAPRKRMKRAWSAVRDSINRRGAFVGHFTFEQKLAFARARGQLVSFSNQWFRSMRPAAHHLAEWELHNERAALVATQQPPSAPQPVHVEAAVPPVEAPPMLPRQKLVQEGSATQMLRRGWGVRQWFQGCFVGRVADDEGWETATLMARV
jgi:hypothetical protein